MPRTRPSGQAASHLAGKAAAIPRAARPDECWINVYPRIDVAGGHFLGWPSLTRLEANQSAIGYGPAIELEPAFVGRCLRKAGVGYRLHVRLKALPLPGAIAITAGDDA